MARDIATTVYTYEDLDEAAQAAAREWFLGGGAYPDYEWWEDTIDDFVGICAKMGVTIVSSYTTSSRRGTTASRPKPKVWFSGFCSQGDGACFEGYLDSKQDAMAVIAREYPEDKVLNDIVAEITRLQWFYDFKLSASVARYTSSYYHSNTMYVNWVDTRDGDDEPPKHHEQEELEELVCEQMQALADWLYGTLESEYEYLTSDEHVIEMIIANEYTFTKEGKRYD